MRSHPRHNQVKRIAPEIPVIQLGKTPERGENDAVLVVTLQSAAKKKIRARALCRRGKREIKNAAREWRKGRVGRERGRAQAFDSPIHEESRKRRKKRYEIT